MKHEFRGDELLFDVETNSLDTNKAIMWYFGAYSYKYKRYIYFDIRTPAQIKLVLSQHKVVIGHNIQDYDIPVMSNKINGYNEDFKFKYRVDTLKIARKKLNLMRNANGEQIRALRFSLDETYKQLFPGKESKGKTPLHLLQKHPDDLTEEEYETVKKYCLNDIRVNKEIFEEMCKQFVYFKHHMNEWNQQSYKWLTKQMGSYAYSVLCHRMGWKETYGGKALYRDDFQGADVLNPKCKEMHGDDYVLDFNSMYPHNNLQFNLWTPAGSVCGAECRRDKCQHFFKGNAMFKVEGAYCIKEHGKVERELQNMYNERVELKKKKDPAEAGLKVTLNSLYGITSDPVFEKAYYPYRASDCTLLGRQELHYADYYFTKRGYFVGGGDTDSIFVHDPFKDPEKLKRHLKNFINILKKYIPFPSETFDMGVDYEVAHFWIFKKKHYIYLTKQGKLIIKGLAIMKHDATHLGQLVFKKYLKQRIIDTGELRIPKTELGKYLSAELQNDPRLAASEFNISDDDNYYKNDTSLQAQIKARYGGGRAVLIKNTRIGVGKATKYCSLEESKKLQLFEIDLSKTWKELSPFYFDDTFRTLNDYTGLNEHADESAADIVI